MTSSEFVRLSAPEKIYGEKNLLQAQLEMLSLTQSFQNYKSLRNDELVLKVALKTKVDAALSALDRLERMLPKSHIKEQSPEEKAREQKKRDKNLTLEQEIARIRAKLASLNQDA